MLAASLAAAAGASNVTDNTLPDDFLSSDTLFSRSAGNSSLHEPNGLAKAVPGFAAASTSSALPIIGTSQSPRVGPRLLSTRAKRPLGTAPHVALWAWNATSSTVEPVAAHPDLARPPPMRWFSLSKDFPDMGSALLQWMLRKTELAQAAPGAPVQSQFQGVQGSIPQGAILGLIMLIVAPLCVLGLHFLQRLIDTRGYSQTLATVIKRMAINFIHTLIAGLFAVYYSSALTAADFNCPYKTDRECDDAFNWAEMFYFSIITHTTVGYGDWSPKSFDAKVAVAFHAWLIYQIAQDASPKDYTLDDILKTVKDIQENGVPERAFRPPGEDASKDASEQKSPESASDGTDGDPFPAPN